jgi:hypothetical protein
MKGVATCPASGLIACATHISLWWQAALRVFLGVPLGVHTWSWYASLFQRPIVQCACQITLLPYPCANPKAVGWLLSTILVVALLLCLIVGQIE